MINRLLKRSLRKLRGRRIILRINRNRSYRPFVSSLVLIRVVIRWILLHLVSRFLTFMVHKVTPLFVLLQARVLFGIRLMDRCARSVLVS